MFQIIEEGNVASVEFYNNWVEEVKKTVPKKRLLVFDVKEGWKPLCDFLNVPIPDQPFPKTNESPQMMSRILKAKIEATFWFICLPILFAFLMYVLL